MVARTQINGHCPAFLLKVDKGVLRVNKVNLLSLGLLAGEDKAAEHVLAMGEVDAVGEAAEIAAQMAEEALGQVGGTQAVSPTRGPTQVGQATFEFGLELSHLGGREGLIQVSGFLPSVNPPMFPACERRRLGGYGRRVQVAW